MFREIKGVLPMNPPRHLLFALSRHWVLTSEKIAHSPYSAFDGAEIVWRFFLASIARCNDGKRFPLGGSMPAWR